MGGCKKYFLISVLHCGILYNGLSDKTVEYTHAKTMHTIVAQVRYIVRKAKEIETIKKMVK